MAESAAYLLAHHGEGVDAEAATAALEAVSRGEQTFGAQAASETARNRARHTGSETPEVRRNRFGDNASAFLPLWYGVLEVGHHELRFGRSKRVLPERKGTVMNHSINLDGAKIVAHYCAKRGNVYELTSGPSSLALRVSPEDRTAMTANWHVEARSYARSNEACIEGWGLTPAAALHDAARAWMSQEPSLADLDWVAIEHKMHAVHAV